MKKIISIFILLSVSLLLVFYNMDNDIVVVEAAEVPQTEYITNQVIKSVSSKAHPYILYDSSDVATLKEKVKSGYSLKAYQYLETTAKKYIKASVSYDTLTGTAKAISGRMLQSYVAYLSTYGMLNNNAQYLNKAVELVINAVNYGNITFYDSANGALSISDYGYAYSLAYDWLYNYMTNEQRKLLKAEMEEIGSWIYSNSSSLNTWGSDEVRRKAWNWNAVTHGALGMICVSLGSHSDWLNLAIDRMKGYYSYAVDSTGASVEGLHYIGYALNTLAVLDCAIYDSTGIEVMEYYPAMQKLPEWSMYMTAPYGNEQAAINQGTKLDNCAATFYIINRFSQSTALWGWERTYNLHNGSGFTSDYAGNGWNIPALIYYENKNLKATEPNSSYNLIKTYEKGLVIARDGWDTNDSMATFTSGWGYNGCWNHPDDNTFTFFAKGESFVIDLGANFKKPSEHNIILNDGVGMYYDGGSSKIDGSIVYNKLLNNGALYLKGDNSDSYRDTVLKTSTRQMIYHGGETTYVLVYDYGESDSAQHSYTTNFYTDKDSTINITKTNQAEIIGANNKESCMVYLYSDSNSSFSQVKTDTTLDLKTTNNAVIHKQATLFITKNSNGSNPTVTFKKVGDATQVKIEYYSNNKKVIDTYLLYDNKQAEYLHTHSIQKVNRVEATCTNNGNIEYYKCIDCNKMYSDSNCTNEISNIVINKKGHNYGNWINEVAATEYSQGIKGHYHCSSCNKNFDWNKNEIYDLNIPMLEATHKHTIIKVDAVEATCMNKGNILYYKCTECNKMYSDENCEYEIFSYSIAKKDHKFGEWNPQIHPTETTKGVKGHFQCEYCHKYFNANKKEIKDIEIPIIKQHTTTVGCAGSIGSTFIGLLSLSMLLIYIKKKRETN